MYEEDYMRRLYETNENLGVIQTPHPLTQSHGRKPSKDARAMEAATRDTIFLLLLMSPVLCYLFGKLLRFIANGFNDYYKDNARDTYNYKDIMKWIECDVCKELSMNAVKSGNLEMLKFLYRNRRHACGMKYCSPYLQ